MALPDAPTPEQRERHRLGRGGTLTPLMCVDKAPEEVASFAALVEESATTGLPWDIVCVASLSGRAGLGFDDAGLLENRFEHDRKRPADHVGGTAWRERIDEGNRMGRIGVLRIARRDGERRSCSGTAGDKMASVHVSPP